jgi:hypothetical protein
MPLSTEPSSKCLVKKCPPSDPIIKDETTRKKYCEIDIEREPTDQFYECKVNNFIQLKDLINNLPYVDLQNIDTQNTYHIILDTSNEYIVTETLNIERKWLLIETGDKDIPAHFVLNNFTRLFVLGIGAEVSLNNAVISNGDLIDSDPIKSVETRLCHPAYTSKGINFCPEYDTGSFGVVAYINHYSAVLTFKNCKFDRNKCDDGILYIYVGEILLDNCNFTNNILKDETSLLIKLFEGLDRDEDGNLVPNGEKLIPSKPYGLGIYATDEYHKTIDY